MRASIFFFNGGMLLFLKHSRKSWHEFFSLVFALGAHIPLLEFSTCIGVEWLADR